MKRLTGNISMVYFKLELADLVAEVNTVHPSITECFSNYLCDGPADISITVTPEDIAFERAKSIREAEVEGLPYVDHSDAYLETIALQRKLTEALFERDALLFHGSVVAVDGQAYLFTAKSGTGKSTHTRLWRQVLGERAVMVNDDKPYLRFTPEGILACGSPWMGKHGLGQNISVPLKAICILERGAENRIRRIEPQEAVSMLFQQSQRPQRTQLLPKYMELIDKLATGVELYRMACNMDPQAAQMAYAAMSGGGKDN